MQVQPANFSDLSQYCTIPIFFLVESVLHVSGDLPGSFSLVEQPVAQPWHKDYDTFNPPSTLPSRWDLANWAIFLAIDGSSPVGGCIVAHNTPGVHRLQGRTDLAVLWDIALPPIFEVVAWGGGYLMPLPPGHSVGVASKSRLKPRTSMSQRVAFTQYGLRTDPDYS